MGKSLTPRVWILSGNEDAIAYGECIKEGCSSSGTSSACITSALGCDKNPSTPGCPEQSKNVVSSGDQNIQDPGSSTRYQASGNINVDQCTESAQSAQKWCSEKSSMYNLMVQQMVAAFKQPEGIGEGCKLQNQLSNMGSAFEGGMAATCSSRHKQCEAICGSAKETLKARVENLELQQKALEDERTELSANTDPTAVQRRKVIMTDLNRLNKDLRQSNGLLATVSGKHGGCVNYSDNVFQKGMNAGLMQVQAYGAKKCSDEVKAAETGFEQYDTNIAFAGDCTSPANAANPVCVKCNADPSAAGCESVTTIHSNHTAANDPFGDGADSFTEGSGAYGAAAFDIGGDDVELDTPGSVQSNSKGSRTIASNSSGGPAGSGSGGGGGLSAPQQPVDPNKKLKTDLVGGEKGGSGYSVSSGGGGGGYSDIAGASSRTPFQMMEEKGFNLKDFLPGVNDKNKKDDITALQKLRQPANIGKSTQNIFEMIHARYRILCLQGRLLGCNQKIPWKKPAWAID